MSKKILVADDYRSLLELHVMGLAERGYTTMGAATGVEAVEILNSNRIDGAILDLQMGIDERTGLSLLDQIRKGLYGDPTIPVLVYSGQSEYSRDAKSVRALGGIYLEKPCRDFYAVVRQLFGPGEIAEDAVPERQSESEAAGV